MAQHSTATWKGIGAFLSLLGVTGATWIALNRSVAAQERDLVNYCERTAKVELRLDRSEEKAREAEIQLREAISALRADVQEVKAILQRMEREQAAQGRRAGVVAGLKGEQSCPREPVRLE